jgi:hypothetical protein
MMTTQFPGFPPGPPGPPRSPGSPDPPLGAGPHPARPARPVRATLALTVATGALVLALTALGVAIFALGRAGTAPATTAQPVATSGPLTTPPATSTDQPTTPIDPPTATFSGTPNPSRNPAEEVLPAASYTVAYEKKSLTLQVECGRNMPIDLDEPRLGAANHELQYHLSCIAGRGPEFTFVDNTPVATAPSPTANAAECAEAIRSSLFGGNNTAVTANLTLCMVTDGAGAQGEGLGRRIALLQVRAVSSGNVADVLVTAWKIPS